MDGNGRWAKSRLMPRIAGHKKGVETTRAIVRHAGEIGIEYLTLYAFSTENWSRPEDEVSDLMGLLRHFLKTEAVELVRNNVKLRVIGSRDRLCDDVREMIEDLQLRSLDNTGLNLTIALDYGSRQEILRAVKQTVENYRGDDAVSDDDIEQSFTSNLYTSDMPDPDLVIRTSGEQRISNFLLWQCAYSEFYFTNILWPDFTTDEFDAAIKDYQSRDRRFGNSESVKT